MTTGGLPDPVRDQLVPRISVGLSRSFEAGDIQDRIVVNTEFYYNGLGYGEDMFEVLSAVEPGPFLSTYYHSGDYGTYYGALFVTINRLFKTNLTLNLSGLGNFSDLSFVALADLAWVPVNNFTLSLSLSSFLGADLREYTTLPRFNTARSSHVRPGRQRLLRGPGRPGGLLVSRRQPAIAALSRRGSCRRSVRTTVGLPGLLRPAQRAGVAGEQRGLEAGRPGRGQVPQRVIAHHQHPACRHPRGRQPLAGDLEEPGRRLGQAQLAGIQDQLLPETQLPCPGAQKAFEQQRRVELGIGQDAQQQALPVQAAQGARAGPAWARPG